METCPCCGEEFDSAEYKIIECQKCGGIGSTACCCSSDGINCFCNVCEESLEKLMFEK
jgi:hypothetical protein